ncbi:hypothetical protein LWI28_017742 [Acer negundo]|uniref:Uncharacterized protein n=1 Tax=Acer negundo TaxID=4023 RepID=A0AAD5JEF7_ACENE|nr:hypothetical protein LWI28_017742 [Acer negundo]
MRTKFQYLSFSSLLFFFICCYLHESVQAQPNTTGYTCTPNQTTYPCQTYAFYRAAAPDFLDLASIADLFSLSRRLIAEPSNISSPSSPLIQDQPLFVPLTCGCHTLNVSNIISFANLSVRIKAGDTFYRVSTLYFQNLTTYQSVEIVNPTLEPTKLEIGDIVYFPIFCKCPNQTQLQNQVKYLVSYVLQPSDNLSSVASMFGVQTQDIIDVNGNNNQPFDTIFVPVTQLPQLTQPNVSLSMPPSMSPSVSPVKTERKGVITGLAIGLAICGVLLILIGGVFIYREFSLKKRREMETDHPKQKLQYSRGGKSQRNKKVNLMADVSDCLDKYRLFKIEDLKEATDGFSEDCLIQGSVYKGFINGEVYAIKMMKWNASEELKILQKVNHGNLVRLEGFCIDPEDANCYLIYEYIESGSLHSWLHENKNGKLSWKTSVDGILEGSEERKVKRMREWMDGVLLQDSCSMESVMSVMSIAIACLHKDPSKRPSMVDIVYALSKSDDLFFDISEDGFSPRQIIAR